MKATDVILGEPHPRRDAVGDIYKTRDATALRLYGAMVFHRSNLYTFHRMPTYCAFLGHNPSVSLAELIAAVPGFSLTGRPAPDVALFSTTEKLSPGLFSTLGGTFAIAEGVDKPDLSLSDGPQVLLELAKKIRGKITFGLRTVGIPPSTIKENYRRYKDTLKRAGRPVRYIGNERKPAAAVLLHDAGIISGKHGIELVIVALPEERIWMGHTIAIQDVDAYTKRDIGKPVRDTTVGLLPPKLAQVMLNLGLWLLQSSRPQLDKSQIINRKSQLTVLDPFCGTGVIPLECLVRGWNVFASDLSLKATNGTQKNIDWIRKEMKILKKDAESTVWKQDACNPFALKKLPDLIVTETSLGPALTRPPSEAPAERLRKQMEKLEVDFLKNAAATLPGVPIVCCWPFWRLHGGEMIRLTGLWEKLPSLGYRAVMPAIPKSKESTDFSLLYRRGEQFVGREIVMLQPVKK
ncbi:MAG: hypothetical protein Greene101449_1078 [Candidatus Peregrinibacteria bacterium Greene1014_49]|nr:MAG: hypothetical protein Greene101449_1078 [Candidatus Peregrinibacteria bacterium Greene1014_49]